jgi:hypothetical protein
MADSLVGDIEKRPGVWTAWDILLFDAQPCGTIVEGVNVQRLPESPLLDSLRHAYVSTLVKPLQARFERCR